MTKLSRQNWTRIARNVAKAQSKIANDLLDVAEAEGNGEVAGPQEVVDAIEVIGRRCTLVVIAHRLTTVMRSDCIYEFEKGHIKATGTYEELNKTSESFKALTYFEKS